jgi:gluconate 2-dehydrogenase gamma chain
MDVQTRRDFLKFSLASARNSLLLLSLPAIVSACREASEAMATAQPFTTLAAEEALELQAIAARIIPTDDTPGATEAGVIYFMDNVLGSSRTEVLEPLRSGLTELQASASARFGVDSFHGLTPEQQDGLLQDIETTPFFNTLRYLTIAGMFTLPSYGGNKDEAGWRMIGFEDRHMWQPPFGHYDADYMEKGA